MALHTLFTSKDPTPLTAGGRSMRESAGLLPFPSEAKGQEN